MKSRSPLPVLIAGCGLLALAGLGAGGFLLLSRSRAMEAEARHAAMAAEKAAMERERARREAEKQAQAASARPLPADASAETRELRDRVRELEEKLNQALARIRELEAAAPAIAAEQPAAAGPSLEERKAKVKEQLGKLAGQGMFALNSEPYKELVRELKAMGAEAIPLLGDLLLQGATTAERFFAGAVIEELGDAAAVPYLLKSMQEEKDTLVRRMSAHALAVGKFAEGRDALSWAMLNDADWGVRTNSAYGLAKMGDARGVQELVKWYEAPGTEAQYKTAILGGIADVGDPSTAYVFRDILRGSQDLSSLLLAIMGAEKTKDASLVPDLQRVLDTSKDGTVREAAEKAIKAIRGY